MNKEEYDLFQSKVKESGRTQQEVVIKAIADLKIASAEEIEELKRLNQMFADILCQLRGATTNINQIARKLHTDGEIPNDSMLYFLNKNILTIMGKQMDAERFSKLYAERKTFFNKTYIRPNDGKTIFSSFLPKKRGTSIDIQTSYVLPLAFNIINDEQKEKAIKNLLETITRENTTDYTEQCRQYDRPHGNAAGRHGHCGCPPQKGFLHPAQLSAGVSASAGCSAGHCLAALGSSSLPLDPGRQVHPDDGLPFCHSVFSSRSHRKRQRKKSISPKSRSSSYRFSAVQFHILPDSIFLRFSAQSDTLQWRYHLLHLYNNKNLTGSDVRKEDISAIPYSPQLLFFQIHWLRRFIKCFPFCFGAFQFRRVSHFLCC